MTKANKNFAVKRIICAVISITLITGVFSVVFSQKVQGGITFNENQIVRVEVGPNDVNYSSFRVGDYGDGYEETDELHPNNRYVIFKVYDNVTKEEKYIYETLPGQFALTSVIDSNFYYSSNWSSDYGGWADTVSHGSYSVYAGNYHIQISNPFISVEEFEPIKKVLTDCGYKVFPAYVEDAYYLRIGGYFSLEEAEDDLAEVLAVYNAAIEILNKTEEENNSSDVPEDNSSDIPSDNSSETPENSSSELPPEDNSSSEIENDSSLNSSEETSSEVNSETSSDVNSNDSSEINEEPENNTSIPENDSSYPENNDNSNSSSELLESDNSSEINDSNENPSEEEEKYIYPYLAFEAVGGSESCITVLDERSGEIYFEFDCAEKWLRAVASVGNNFYHRVYSMSAAVANRNMGRTYYGSIDIARVPENDYTITTVSNVNLDDYIKGVLMREMGNSSNQSLYEAYRTQAIVARTYVLRKILTSSSHGKNSAHGFDICDGSHCQVYGGNIQNATKMVSDAVETTSRMVITYKNSKGNDSLIEAVYSASNGGFSLSNYQYWGTTQTSYLHQVEDTYEDLDNARFGRWETEFTPADLRDYINYLKENLPDYFRLLRNYTSEGFITGKEYTDATRLDKEVGKIVKFYAEVVTPLGDIPMKLVFEDEFGTKVYVQYGGNIKSFMSKNGMGIPGFETAAVKSPNFHIHYKFDDFYVVSGSVTEKYSGKLNETYVLTADGLKTIEEYPFELEIKTSNGIEFLNPERYKYIIKGTGWGHGVGLSQEGTFGRSKAGFTAEEIIHHYYTNVNIILVD